MALKVCFSKDVTKKTIISFILTGIFWANFALAGVIINEIAWMGTETSSQDEWIELYNNNSASAVNLDGWTLKAVDGVPEIRLTGKVLANGFYLLERTDDETLPDIPADQIYTGALKNSGETLQLYDEKTTLIDTVDCSSGWFAGDNSSKQTMERLGSYPNQWVDSQNPGGTPKAQNSAPLLSEKPSRIELSTTTDESEPEPEVEVEGTATGTEPVIYPSGIVITEILPSPLGPDAEEEWIEIFNENATKSDISLWQITDTVGVTKTYTFPEKTIIAGHGFLILYRPVSKITLNNSGDTLNLIQPNGNILDTVFYEKAPRDYSYSKTIYGWRWTNVLTPGQINIVPAPKKDIREAISDTIAATGARIEELAAIGEQIPKSSKPIKIFLIALFLAICCAILIFALKKRLTSSPTSRQNNLRLPFK